MTEQTPVKRGRGRPRKHPEAVGPKRPVGRPVKPKAETGPKRPVGRPPKPKDPALETIKANSERLREMARAAVATAPVKNPTVKPKPVPAEAATPAPKRGRGRPPKETPTMNDRGEPFEPVPENIDPKDFLQGVLCGKYAPDATRIKVAQVLMRFVHTATHDGGKKESRQREADQAATNSDFAPMNKPRLAVNNG